MLTPRDDESLMTFWISLWPTAPLFGVRWRFEGMMPTNGFFSPGEIAADMFRASANEARKATSEMTEKAMEVAPAEIAEPLREAAQATLLRLEDLGGAAARRPSHLYSQRPDEDEIDDLTRIRGIGPKVAGMLNDLGVYRIDQIAEFNASDIAWVDDNLATFKGRAHRDDWVGQAKSLTGA